MFMGVVDRTGAACPSRALPGRTPGSVIVLLRGSGGSRSPSLASPPAYGSRASGTWLRAMSDLWGQRGILVAGPLGLSSRAFPGRAPGSVIVLLRGSGGSRSPSLASPPAYGSRASGTRLRVMSDLWGRRGILVARSLGLSSRALLGHAPSSVIVGLRGSGGSRSPSLASPPAYCSRASGTRLRVAWDFWGGPWVSLFCMAAAMFLDST